MTRYFVCRRDELTDGERKVVACDGKEIAVFAVEGELYGWHNQCAHQGGPVCQGRIYNRVVEPFAEDGTTRFQYYDNETFHIVCPWHGYEYDVRTGTHPGSAKVKLRPVQLEVDDDSVYALV